MAQQQMFGSFDPELTKQAIAAQEEQSLLAQARLSPAEVQRYVAASAGRQLGGIVGGIFGVEAQDPRLRQAQLAQEAYQEALTATGGNADSPEFMAAFSNSAARRNLPTLAQQAAAQASELTKARAEAFKSQAAGVASYAQAQKEKAVSPLDQARTIVLQLSNRTDLTSDEQRLLQNANEVLKLEKPPGTVVNMAQETKFAGERGTEQAKALTAAASAAATARSALTTLDQMETLAKDEKLYTGPLAMTALGAANFLNSVGLLSSGQARTLANAEIYDKNAKDLVMLELGGKLGAQISNTDRDFIEARIPQLKNSPKARLEIIQKLREIQNGKIGLYTRMNQHANKYNNLNDFDFSQNYVPADIVAPSGKGTRDNPIKLK